MALFGRMLAAGFAGVGEGLGEAAKAQDERIAEERARRDKLMQQALIFAKNDKDKYDVAKENKKNLVSAIDSRLSQYSDKFGSDKERLAAAAEIAKKYTTMDAANNYLNLLDDNYARNSDSINFAFTSKMDPKQLEQMSLDTVSGSLVSSTLRPKQWSTYYNPAEYQTDSLLFRGNKTPASLTQQAEQAQKLGEAAGLTERYDDSVAAPSVGLPKLTPKVPTETFENRMYRLQSQLDQAIRRKAPKSEIDSLTAETAAARQRHLDLVAAESVARNKGTSGLGITPAFINSVIDQAGKKEGTYQTYLTSPKMQRLFSIQDRTMEPSDDVAFSAQQETAYQLYLSAKKAAGEDITEKDLNKIAMGAQNVMSKDRLELSERFRLDNVTNGKAGDYTPLMNYLKSIDKGSKQYGKLSKPHMAIVDFFNAQKNKQEMTRENVIDATYAFGTILSVGYFVPDRILKSNNFNIAFTEIFGIPPQYDMGLQNTTTVVPPVTPPPPKPTVSKPTGFVDENLVSP